MSKSVPNLKDTIPNPSTFLGGGSKDRKRLGGAITGSAFGMPLPFMGFNDQFNRKHGKGEGPAFLNPGDWFNGKLQGELTGDTTKDMKYGLAKYGLFAAPWAPALYNESNKLGEKNKEAEAQRMKQEAYYANFQNVNPTIRNPIGGNFQGFQGGYYNDAVNQLIGNAQNYNNLGGLL